MATDLRTSPDAPSDDPIGDDLPLFRFGLRQLLVVFTFASLLIAALATSSGLTALVLLLAAAIVALHLFSTALGTNLRWHANRSLQHEAQANESRNVVPESSSPGAPDSRHRSPWHERRSTPLPWLPRLVVAASLAGGTLGAVLLGVTIGDHTSPAGIAVGAFSMAVVAGWFAFVACSFYGVFRHGLRDAMADDRRVSPH